MPSEVKVRKQRDILCGASLLWDGLHLLGLQEGLSDAVNAKGIGIAFFLHSAQQLLPVPPRVSEVLDCYEGD